MAVDPEQVTPEAMRYVALAIAQQRVLSARCIPEESLPLVFLCPPVHITADDLTRVAVFAIYGDDVIVETPFPTGSKLPQFRTCRVWPIADFDRAIELGRRARQQWESSLDNVTSAG